jgi:hypothetical protein
MSVDAQTVRLVVAEALLEYGRGEAPISQIIADTLALAEAIWTGKAPPPPTRANPGDWRDQLVEVPGFEQ